jgi:Fe-S-cluster-containing dehydrogenase component
MAIYVCDYCYREYTSRDQAEACVRRCKREAENAREANERQRIIDGRSS